MSKSGDYEKLETMLKADLPQYLESIGDDEFIELRNHLQAFLRILGSANVISPFVPWWFTLNAIDSALVDEQRRRVK